MGQSNGRCIPVKRLVRGKKQYACLLCGKPLCHTVKEITQVVPSSRCTWQPRTQPVQQHQTEPRKGPHIVTWHVGDREVGNLAYYWCYPPRSPAPAATSRHVSHNQHHSSPADFQLAFGKHVGDTLGDIFIDEPLYIDWLASQDWLTPATRRAINRFLAIPEVRNTIDNLTEFDHRCGGRWQTSHCFMPSQQTSPRFAHGKPNWLRIEWYPREEGPVFDPDSIHGTLRELNNRLGTDHDEPAYDPPPITKPSQAWRLAATLLDWIEQCDEIQDIDLPPQVKQIEQFLPSEVMIRIRTGWYRKAHQWDGAFI